MKEMVLLPQPRGARDLLCPALGAQICPSRSSELLYICNCLSQLRFPRKIQHLRPAPRPGKRGLGPIRAALATTHREIVLRFEAFSLRVVWCCVPVRTGNASKRGTPVVGPTVLVGHRLKALCGRLLLHGDCSAPLLEVIRSIGDAAACHGVVWGGRTG